MRLGLVVAGVLLILAGGVWFFQGIGLLPGSFMSGQSIWALYGGLAALIGLGLIALGRRRP